MRRKNSLGFWDTNRLPSPSQEIRTNHYKQTNKKRKKEKEENLLSSWFAAPVDHWEEVKSQVLKLCLRTKKAVEREGDGDTNCSWCTWNGPKEFERKLGELEIGGRIVTI